MSEETEHLPVHGFVLAGGKSSRMGQDKAVLHFGGLPMVERALDKLRSFCREVSLSGNRDDLAGLAPVVPETRLDSGPVAGVEACLAVATQPWCLFIPVDVPLVPKVLLEGWTRAVMTRPGTQVSYLVTKSDRQPTFCLLQRVCAPALHRVVQTGQRRLGRVLEQTAEQSGSEALWVAEAEAYLPASERAAASRFFGNVNTPEELAMLQSWAAARDRPSDILAGEKKRFG